MHLPSRHSSLLPPEPDSTQHRHSHSTQNERRSERYTNAIVAQAAAGQRLGAEAEQLGDDDADHAERDAGAQVAQERALQRQVVAAVRDRHLHRHVLLPPPRQLPVPAWPRRRWAAARPVRAVRRHVLRRRGHRRGP